MKQAKCPFEEEIGAASRSCNWSDALLAHIARCPVCEEVALVACYLSESVAAPVPDTRLPDPGRIWSRAQIAANSAAMERALRPIVWARRFAFGACAAVIVVAVVIARSRVGGLFTEFGQLLTLRPAEPHSGHDNFLLFTVALFVLILPPLLFGFYSAWSED